MDLMVSEEKIFFPIISLWELIPQGMASLGPGGLNGRIYVWDH